MPPSRFEDRTRVVAASRDPAIIRIHQWIDRLLQPHTPQDVGTPAFPTGQSKAAPVQWFADTIDPTIGNGTLQCSWREFGDIVMVHLYLQIGSTTTLGTGTYLFTIPFPADSTVHQSIGGHTYRAGAGMTAAVQGVVTGLVIAPVVRGDGTVLDGAAGWVAGDVLALQGFYRPL